MAKKQQYEENLYDILGVDKEATEQDIKKAYRKKAVKNHPDKGGSSDEFSKIAFAYKVLSDPNERKKYDDTGVTSDTPDEEKAAVEHIKMILNKAISNECQHEFMYGFSREGIAGILKKVIKKQIAEASEVITNTESTIEKLEKLRKKTRLKKNAKRKFDIFASTCEEILEQAKNHKAGAEHQLKMLKRAQEIAADYEDVSTEENDLSKEIMGKIGCNFDF